MQSQNSKQSLFYQQLKQGKFKESQFNKNTQNHKLLIEFLKNLEVPKTSQQTKILLSTISHLVKFYGISIAICLNSFYQKIAKQSDLVLQNSQIFKDIATYFKYKIKNRKFTQLSFIFNLCGTSRKKFNLNQSKQQQQFMNYIDQLGKLLDDLQMIVQKGSKGMTQKQFREKINNSIVAILELDMPRKGNLFQVNYQNYFKSLAMNTINEIQENFDLVEEKPLQNTMDIDKSIQQQKNILNIDPNAPLCCRTFFFKNQSIHQPQSLHLQYKNYKKFPWPNTLIDILKKTICGFLNSQGGIIFIGIAQPVQSKRRIVIGSYYDQSAKQDVLKCFRRIADSIQPNIITHKIYKVQFVPIRKNIHPYNYISGKYVIKVVIRYGVRDDIYSYKSQGSQEDLYAFRTQNEVVHKKGRVVLNALKQRVKNPLPIPQPLHQGSCPKPEIGKPVYYGQNFDLSFEDTVILPKNKFYQSKKNIQQKKNQIYQEEKSQSINRRGNRFNDSNSLNNILQEGNNKIAYQSQNNLIKNTNVKLYRQKYTYFLIKGATSDKLKAFWTSHGVPSIILTANKIQTDLILLQLSDINMIQQFIKLFQTMKNELSITITNPSLVLKFFNNISQGIIQAVVRSMSQKKMQFQRKDKKLFFKDIKIAVKGYHLITSQFGINVQFEYE